MGNLKQWLGWMKMVLLALSIGAGACGCGGGSSTQTPGNTVSITSISPRSAPAGALAFTLNVTGANFLPTSTVEWNGNSRTTTFVSGSQLQAHIMAADLAAPGTVTVTVVNAAPNAGKSNGSTFTIAPDTVAFLSGRALDGSDAMNTNNTPNIWVMNPDSSNPTPLTKLTANIVSTFNQVWSPDGNKIAFISTRALNGNDAQSTNDVFNIWVVNADGSNAQPLTRLTASNANSLSLAWSPDGSKIVFDSQRALDGSDAANINFSNNIWVMNADGSNPMPLTKLTSGFAMVGSVPVWSPDGSKIAFVSTRALSGNDLPNLNHTANVWVMNADGSTPIPLTRLTAPNSDCFQPVWSLDGSKIAFSSQRALDGSDTANANFVSNVWVMNADGSNLTAMTKLTALASSSRQPAWSPDGSKILFASLRALDGSNASNANNTSNLWVMNADGSNATALTKLMGGSVSFNAIWSPGGKILFVSDRTLDGSDAISPHGTVNIWVVNADGTNPLPLTKLTATDCDVPQQP